MRETRNPGLHLLRIAVMKVLVVGGGGREHAIVEALRRSQADVYAAMSNQNPGIRRPSKDVLLGDVTDVERIVSWAKGHGIELAVIGPAEPLAGGGQVGEKKSAGTARFRVEENLGGEGSPRRAFCDGGALVPMPLAQEHKRAHEGDKAPNTGGRGPYSDAAPGWPFLTTA